jgi:hypothetical protein
MLASAVVAMTGATQSELSSHWRASDGGAELVIVATVDAANVHERAVDLDALIAWHGRRHFGVDGGGRPDVFGYCSRGRFTGDKAVSNLRYSFDRLPVLPPQLPPPATPPTHSRSSHWRAPLRGNCAVAGRPFGVGDDRG